MIAEVSPMTRIPQAHGDRYSDSSWKDQRKLVFGVSREEIARELENSGQFSHASRLLGCGSRYHLCQCEGCDEIVLSGSRCESRVCFECGEKKLIRLIAKEKDFLKGLPTDPRGKHRATILTLTLKNVPDKNYGKHVYKEFLQFIRRFFTHPEIKGRIRGGIRSIETKRPKEGYVYHKKDGSTYVVPPGRGWNIHMHSLIDADYIPIRKISRVWREISGSYIVDARAVKAGIPALIEILKYTIKPPNLGDAKSYARYLSVTKGLRLFNTFGNWREDHFGVFVRGDKRCSVCRSRMAYLFSVPAKEGLRWREYLKGPPKDIFGGYIHFLGPPHTLQLVKDHGTGHIGQIVVEA
ncbi:MAG: protein rep [Candidatus Hydrothermarchaeales archaeon]